MTVPAAQATRILVGVVGAPHGIRGELRVKSYMAVPAAIADHVLFLAPTGGQGRRMVTARALKDDMVVARLEGVASREAAAALTGTSLYIDRAALPAADEDEFYHADLVGLPVRTTAGVAVGTITALLDFGAGDLLEIATLERETRLIPFAKAFVPVVDIAAGIVIVTPEAVAPADEGEDDAAMGDTAGDRSA